MRNGWRIRGSRTALGVCLSTSRQDQRNYFCLVASGDTFDVDKYIRGSGGHDAESRVKVMKLLWDAIGTEFGGRHELYERNYAGNHEDIRIQALWSARSSGIMEQMTALADQCMAEYDENGWTVPTWLDPDDVAYPGLPGERRAAE